MLGFSTEWHAGIPRSRWLGGRVAGQLAVVVCVPVSIAGTGMLLLH